MGSWWEKIWAERWVSALIVVLVGLVVTFLMVLFWGRGANRIVQLFGASGISNRASGISKIRGPEVSRHRHGRRAARPASR